MAKRTSRKVTLDTMAPRTFASRYGEERDAPGGTKNRDSEGGHRRYYRDPRHLAAFKHERAQAVADQSGQTRTQVERSMEFRANWRLASDMWRAEYRAQRDARHYYATQEYLKARVRAGDNQAAQERARTNYEERMLYGAQTSRERQLARSRMESLSMTTQHYADLSKRNPANNRENYKAGGEYAHALEYIELRSDTASWDVGDS